MGEDGGDVDLSKGIGVAEVAIDPLFLVAFSFVVGVLPGESYRRFVCVCVCVFFFVS